MHVGMTLFLQGDKGARSDAEVYAAETRLGDLAEPLGFDSLWSVEHHFTDYTMCPDVLQLLTYFAGRTRRVELGSMVVVLPWHNPMRVAEQAAMLDHLSGGRLVLGIGRGLARVEFEGMGVEMAESRERFDESAEMLIAGLERGWCEYQGKVIRQPRRDIRPQPTRSFRGRVRAAANSIDSMRVVARLGLGLLVVPQKPWDVLAQEVAEYRRLFREHHGVEAPPPRFLANVFCDEDPERADALGRAYLTQYWKSVLAHYELFAGHLGRTRGYEAYGAIQQTGMDDYTRTFLGLQVWGTPEQCYERVVEGTRKLGGDGFMGTFSYGGMPYDLAESSLRLFARRVLPELRACKPGVQ
jgi:alkanesulfonate monooxygenase SsuD/methylene tetrahydromethanopterin reductase-like flavin-dependent oxidoreductase (luciferase family)